jgi:MoCo/4Fe-4S cofactor protein with predicted Tat translocation signal
MKDNQKKYWKGIEELSNDPEFLKHAYNEFPDYLPVKEAHPSKAEEGQGAGRRDFLKLLGFGVAAVSLAACEAPVQKAIPYLNKPEEVEPGIANWYASTYMNGSDYCSVLVKTREGRPIKIEGNSLSSITKGGTSARTQASVLNLYDETRLQNFHKKGTEIAVKENNKEYAGLDREIAQELAKADGQGIRIVSNTIYSPTTLRVIEEFKGRYGSTVHVQYDAVSAYGIRQANKETIGREIIPAYDFSKADVVVGFNCDFLGTWISPIEFAGQYASRRKVGESNKTMSRHYQFESNFSLTGANADYREPIKLSEEGLFLAALYAKITGSKLSVGEARKSQILDMAADDLKKAKGKSLVVSGSNNKSIQILVNAINDALGNYGSSINAGTECNLKKGNDFDAVNFVQDLKSGKVGAVIFLNANPVYDLAWGAEVKEALKKVPVKISLASKIDETAEACDYVCPGLHYLETWGDAEPYAGFYSLCQPTITPIFKGTRAAQESLLVWAGNKTDYYTYLKNNWKQSILRNGSDDAWNKALHDGVFEPSAKGGSERPVAAPVQTDSAQATVGSQLTAAPVNPDADFAAGAGFEGPASGGGSVSVNADLGAVASGIAELNKSLSGSDLELSLYESVAMGDGSMANNPWLQELPDPITKATWDNYITLSYADARDKYKVAQGEKVKLTIGQYSVEVPVVVQPGQAIGTAGIALGYGRTKAVLKGLESIGTNAYPAVSFSNGTFAYAAGKVKVEKAEGTNPIATTQTHDTVMERQSVIKEDNLKAYQAAEWQRPYNPKVHTPGGPVAPGDPSTDLWYQHDKENHLWTMMIDLNSCIGCGTCVVACNVENNVPVVGKQEVINRREMHWMRIDRYYSTDMSRDKAKKEGVGVFEMYDKMEVPSENPEVVFQPMLCQHCNHAPCETVCPVAATNHSSEGLNQMAYNRCIGTRYCANNCPYKVRRFNWFKYFDNDQFDHNTAMNTTLGKMVLNPDVTVRSRGVMEKCSFCVQRIQEGKLNAKKEKRRPKDGEVVTACASSCPTNAITFGDINDQESKVFKQLTEENKKRAYTVLEEINTRPNVYYLTKIRNKKA